MQSSPFGSGNWCYQPLNQDPVSPPPLRYKVLPAIENIPTNAWSLELVQTIIGSACFSFELTPASVTKTDMSQFFVVPFTRALSRRGWMRDPGAGGASCWSPTPHIREEELIHSKWDTL
jgi:hypothetical protein